MSKAHGRLAMVGFVAGTTALIGYASYKTDDIDVWPIQKPFTPGIELLSGSCDK